MSQSYKIVERLNAECFCKNCPTCEAASLIQELGEALSEMVYETTHLSPLEDDGSHKCRITGTALAQSRAILSKLKEA